MPNGAKNYTWTLNNYTEDEEQLIVNFAEGEDCQYLIFGHEVGENDTPHLQGFLQLKSKKTIVWLKRNLNERAHYEVTRGTPEENKDYCTKDDEDYEEFGEMVAGPGRGGGQGRQWEIYKDWIKEQTEVITEEMIAAKFTSLYGRYRANAMRLAALLGPQVDLSDGNEPRAWQTALRGQLEVDADDRKIIFVVDPDGGSGKSWFCKWMVSDMEGVQVLNPGKRDDLAHCIVESNRVFLVNVPRGSMEFLHYGILEMLKDRMVFSPKYESRMKKMHSNVHVVVFSNEDPDMEKMTDDRYEFFTHPDCSFKARPGGMNFDP
ncbi:hypothetical protein THIOSC15_1180002 [uncultured Thiomicrorhabdus sp.]